MLESRERQRQREIESVTKNVKSLGVVEDSEWQILRFSNYILETQWVQLFTENLGLNGKGVKQTSSDSLKMHIFCVTRIGCFNF